MGVGVAGVGVDGVVVVVIEEEGTRERGERGVEDGGGGERVSWQRRVATLCHAQPQRWYVIDLKPLTCKLLWCNG